MHLVSMYGIIIHMADRTNEKKGSTREGISRPNDKRNLVAIRNENTLADYVGNEHKYEPLIRAEARGDVRRTLTEQDLKDIARELGAKQDAEALERSYAEGAEAFAITIREKLPPGSTVDTRRLLKVYKELYTELYRKALAAGATPASARGIAAQVYRYDDKILEDAFEARGITKESPASERQRVLAELAENKQVKEGKGMLLEAIMRVRIRRGIKQEKLVITSIAEQPDSIIAPKEGPAEKPKPEVATPKPEVVKKPEVVLKPIVESKPEKQKPKPETTRIKESEAAEEQEVPEKVERKVIDIKAEWEKEQKSTAARMEKLRERILQTISFFGHAMFWVPVGAGLGYTTYWGALLMAANYAEITIAFSTAWPALLIGALGGVLYSLYLSIDD